MTVFNEYDEPFEAFNGDESSGGESKSNPRHMAADCMKQALTATAAQIWIERYGQDGERMPSFFLSGFAAGWICHHVYRINENATMKDIVAEYQEVLDL